MLKNKKQITKIFFFTIILLAIFGLAEDSWAVDTHLAVDCTRDKVSDAIEVADYGDTVQIPAGNCAWTSGIIITKDLRIIGTGIGSTVIINNTPPIINYYSYIFKFIPDETARNNLDSLVDDIGAYEIAGITFTSLSIVAYRAHLLFSNTDLPIVQRIKIHNNRFENTSMSMTCGSSYLYGVIYENQFYNSRGMKMQGAGYLSFKNMRMFPGDGKGWYIEDNTYIVDNAADCMVGSGTNNGGALIIRYNTATGVSSNSLFMIESHGNQDAGIYGPQHTEIYGNNFNVTRSSLFYDGRGGKNLIFYNKYAPATGNVIRFREEFSDWVSSTTNPANRCVDNPGEVQICTNYCICQKVHDSYVFVNKTPTNNNIGILLGSDYDCQSGTPVCAAKYGAGPYPVINNPPELVENREFWKYNANYNGTTEIGIGCGVTLPRACTIGDGFWVTTQDCSSVSDDNIGANPEVPISGILYRCTSKDNWTSYYTPYIYPHPLRNENPTDFVPPAMPSGLSVR